MKFKESVFVFPVNHSSEAILKICQKIKANRILDMGCGTGFIGINLSNNQTVVHCVDKNKNALKLTETNKSRFNKNVSVYYSNMFSKVKDRFDLIIFNPPLIIKNNKLVNVLIYYIHKFKLTKLFHNINPMRSQWEQRSIFMKIFLDNALKHLLKEGLIVTIFSDDEIKKSKITKYEIVDKKPLFSINNNKIGIYTFRKL